MQKHRADYNNEAWDLLQMSEINVQAEATQYVKVTYYE